MNKSNIFIWKKVITGKITSFNSNNWEYEFLNHPTTEGDYPTQGQDVAGKSQPFELLPKTPCYVLRNIKIHL